MNLRDMIEKLEDARYARGLTQAELAEEMGIAQPTMANYTRRENIQISTLARWAAHLGLELTLAPVKQVSLSDRQRMLVDDIWERCQQGLLAHNLGAIRLVHTIDVTEADALEMLCNRTRPSARYAAQEILEQGAKA